MLVINAGVGVTQAEVDLRAGSKRDLVCGSVVSPSANRKPLRRPFAKRTFFPQLW